MAFIDDFRAAMKLHAAKQVTKTDKDKGAYVPDAQQRALLSLAGFEPVQVGQAPA